MPGLFFFLRRWCWLGLLPGLAGCARRQFSQPDARGAAALSAPLPPGADSVLATAGRQYDAHSGLYRLLLGRHYRRSWAAPVAVPVLDLATAVPGGLRPGRPGGGYQTISLTLTGADGRDYALRALDKDPSKTLPGFLRRSFVFGAVRDATSAANPYGALVVPPLAEAAGVPHASPRLVYVRPDARDLGPTSERFRGKLALLEEKFNKPIARTPALAAATDLVGGEEMLAAVYASPRHAIDQPDFLRARLLDLWLGDWDRHEGQWQWARFEEPGGTVRYEPVPKDRDQVFFRFDDGLVPWVMSRPFALSRFQTFGAGYGNVRGLVSQATFIDQRGLSELPRSAFRRTAAELQRRLPDSVIDRAVRHLPAAAYALEGAFLARTLKARRETLPQAADAFYEVLARQPVIGGTAGGEQFRVQRYRDSTVVTIGSRAAGPAPWYQRTFYRRETRCLTLDALDGNDLFTIETHDKAAMPLALYGGKGQDELQVNGPGRRLKFYDQDAGNTAASQLRPHLPRKNRRAYDRLNDD